MILFLGINMSHQSVAVETHLIGCTHSRTIWLDAHIHSQHTYTLGCIRIAMYLLIETDDESSNWPS